MPPTPELAALLCSIGFNDEDARRGALVLVRLTLGWVATEQTRISITGDSSGRDAMEEHDFETTLNLILRGLNTD